MLRMFRRIALSLPVLNLKDFLFSNQDPYWNNISLAIPMSGTNGQITFSDISPRPKTVTRNGNVVIQTAVQMMGSSSAYFDGDADFLSIPTHADLQLGLDDFAIDANIYITGDSPATPENQTPGVIATTYVSGFNGGYSFSLGADGSNNQILYFGVRNASNAIVAAVGSYPLVVERFKQHHVAAVRKNGIIYLFFDGKLVATGNGNVDISNSAPTYIGMRFNAVSTYSSEFKGNINRFRISKHARWTSDFIVPTSLT